MQDSPFEPRLRTGERVAASLFRLAVIAFVWGAVIVTRSSVLSAAAAGAHLPAAAVAAQPVQPLGEWKETRGGKGGLSFGPDGQFRETWDGKPWRRGTFRATKGLIRVTDIRDEGGRIHGVRNHAMSTLDAVEYRVNLTDDRLEVTQKREEWLSDAGILHLVDWFPPQNYHRRKDPPPAPPGPADPEGF
jgi:hypothetical protein